VFELNWRCSLTRGLPESEKIVAALGMLLPFISSTYENAPVKSDSYCEKRLANRGASSQIIAGFRQ
jgi:hypothetical protein